MLPDLELDVLSEADRLENREAEAMLRKVLRDPVGYADRKLAKVRRFRTAGVVRVLVAASKEAGKVETILGLLYADLAVCVAERLPASRYPVHAVDRERGRAWTQLARAQLSDGQYRAAHSSLANAEEAFSKIPLDDLDLVELDRVRKLVLHAANVPS